jgi:hypothetical protein
MISPSAPQSRPIPLLRETSLREFVLAGSLTKVRAVGRTGGYEVQVEMGAASATLGNTRGGVRLFGSVDSITALLQRLGISAFEVDIAHFSPAPLKTLRAEISAATNAASQGKTELE